MLEMVKSHDKKHLLDGVFSTDVQDQFLHVETETETQRTQSQLLILRLKFLKLVSNFETESETFLIGLKKKTDIETFVFVIKN